MEALYSGVKRLGVEMFYLIARKLLKELQNEGKSGHCR